MISWQQRREEDDFSVFFLFFHAFPLLISWYAAPDVVRRFTCSWMGFFNEWSTISSVCYFYHHDSSLTMRSLTIHEYKRTDYPRQMLASRRISPTPPHPWSWFDSECLFQSSYGKDENKKQPRLSSSFCLTQIPSAFIWPGWHGSTLS